MDRIVLDAVDRHFTTKQQANVNLAPSVQLSIHNKALVSHAPNSFQYQTEHIVSHALPIHSSTMPPEVARAVELGK